MQSHGGKEGKWVRKNAGRSKPDWRDGASAGKRILSVLWIRVQGEKGIRQRIRVSSLSVQWFYNQFCGISGGVDDGSHLLIRAIDEAFAIPFQDLVTRLQTHLIRRTRGQDPGHVSVETSIQFAVLATRDEETEAFGT